MGRWKLLPGAYQDAVEEPNSGAGAPCGAIDSDPAVILEEAPHDPSGNGAAGVYMRRLPGLEDKDFEPQLWLSL